MEITRFTLANGLRVVHVHDTTTAMVAVNTLYDVGARDESAHLTGMAHLFEHLMFSGTPEVPDFDAPLSVAGGMSNAWTSNDYTNFYDVLPAVNIETALWLESDRMRGLAFSEKGLQVQKSVVIEEFKQVCLNQPYGDSDHALRRLAYTVHPYRYPVIGKEFSHIELVTPDDERRWFYSHYAPNNAVLAICGNVDAQTVRTLVEKWYADIPARPIAPRNIPAEPLPDAPRSGVLTGNVPQTVLTIAYPMAPYGQQAYFEADIISDVLANGQASRFYRELLMGTDLFTDIDAAIQGAEEPGLFLINANLRDTGREAEEQAIRAIDAQLEKISTEPVDAHTLQLCINRLESSRTFGMLNYLTVAQTLAMSEMHHENPDDFMRPYLAITPQSLQHTARTLFNPSHRILLTYRPA